MRFWTIQPRSLSQQLETGGTLRVDPDHPRYGGKRPWQYVWLSKNLQRSCSGFDGGWPWWLACDPPDLDRARSSSHPGGKHQALIELELPEDRCASFPLWMWETIHMKFYLALSVDELDSWHRELRAAIPERSVWPLPEPWMGRLQASWLRVFDHSLPSRCWYRDVQPRGEDADLQRLMAEASDVRAGWTQALSAGDVMSVTPFIAQD